MLLHCSTYTVKSISSQWTTSTSHITIIGKLFGLLILPEDCSAQRFNSLKLHSSLRTFDFDHSGEVLSNFTPVTPAEVSQLLQSMSNKSSPLDYIPISILKSCTDTFSNLISHLANLSFTQATFPSKFKLALISPPPPAEKTWFTKLGSRFQANIQSEYHRQNPRASRFLLTFQNLRFFFLYSLLIANSILLRLLCLNSQMISWKPLTLEKLQCSLWQN